MRVSVNGIEREFSAAPALVELLAEAVGPGAPPGVAVAVNGEVVRRANWAAVRLADGDTVEIVKALQGG